MSRNFRKSGLKRFKTKELVWWKNLPRTKELLAFGLSYSKHMVVDFCSQLHLGLFIPWLDLSIHWFLIGNLTNFTHNFLLMEKNNIIKGACQTLVLPCSRAIGSKWLMIRYFNQGVCQHFWGLPKNAILFHKMVIVCLGENYFAFDTLFVTMPTLQFSD